MDEKKWIEFMEIKLRLKGNIEWCIELNWIQILKSNSIEYNSTPIQLNWIQNQSKKNGMQIGGKGTEFRIYSWTWCCKEKLSKRYKYKKSHLHASLHGNGLNVFQFGMV